MNEMRKSFSGPVMRADAVKDIQKINKYALRELSPEEVFCFNVNLCDTQVDRDLEAFSVKSLEALAKLFLGKPLIQDHSWSASNQQGRIYATQVVKDGSVSRLRASVYILRTPGTAETIAQIEAGVLKEVSIGFTCKKTVCSVCGTGIKYDYMTRKRKCENDHVIGETVNGKIVHGIMEDPADAYEVSLVAVPSQRQAGITKGTAGRREISDEEWEERRKLFEDNINNKVSDDIWEAIKAGKLSAAEVAAAHRKEPESVKKTYPDYVPDDDFSGDSIRYVMIPYSAIDNRVRVASFRALGFCRKELELQPIQISWFASDQDARRLGLNLSALKSFYNVPELQGIASRKNPNLIILRYPRDCAGVMKTIFHECWHAFQMKDEHNPLNEDSAYWYMEDAFKRYNALSEDDKESLFLDELVMKDYRKK